MSDVIAYSDALRINRASCVLSRIDAATSRGKLILYAGPRQAVSADPSSVPLAEVVLSKPCGAVSAQAELVFAPVSDVMVHVSGTATWARMSDGDGNTVADFDVGLPGSGAAIIMTDTSMNAGALVRVTLAKLIEP